jgi:hypothetical protein
MFSNVVLFFDAIGGLNAAAHSLLALTPESNHSFFFIDTFVSLAIPSLQLRLTTSLFSNLDSTLKTNTQM